MPIEKGLVSEDNYSFTTFTKTHFWPNEDLMSGKVGKSKAGRLLDGVEWNEYPGGD